MKQLGSGDVGLVDLVQVQGDPESRYAMKTLEKREMLERNKVRRQPDPAILVPCPKTTRQWDGHCRLKSQRYTPTW